MSNSNNKHDSNYSTIVHPEQFIKALGLTIYHAKSYSFTWCEYLDQAEKIITHLEALGYFNYAHLDHKPMAAYKIIWHL